MMVVRMSVGGEGVLDRGGLGRGGDMRWMIWERDEEDGGDKGGWMEGTYNPEHHSTLSR